MMAHNGLIVVGIDVAKDKVDACMRSLAHSSLVPVHAHRIPHPTFVTIAKRPSHRARDARKPARDLPVVTSDDPAAHWHDGQIRRRLMFAMSSAGRVPLGRRCPLLKGKPTFLPGAGGCRFCPRVVGACKTKRPRLRRGLFFIVLFGS